MTTDSEMSPLFWYNFPTGGKASAKMERSSAKRAPHTNVAASYRIPLRVCYNFPALVGAGTNLRSNAGTNNALNERKRATIKTDARRIRIKRTRIARIKNYNDSQLPVITTPIITKYARHLPTMDLIIRTT